MHSLNYIQVISSTILPCLEFNRITSEQRCGWQHQAIDFLLTFSLSTRWVLLPMGSSIVPTNSLHYPPAHILKQVC